MLIELVLTLFLFVLQFLLLDDLTHSLEFFYLALLSLLCYNYFVSTSLGVQLNNNTSKHV